ncbi:Protein TWIN LOV 1 [Triticum urartu]|uniref:Protein TWIN LOV 1 n=1 Tax=Triticum urartu TaxID=4572 RepID=M8AEZ5_TRIUA|nr:Protein TWIN LOV 1 [Triticum urartu]
MPIVYASDAFLSLTGYSREEILGCNCRFLNGPDYVNNLTELLIVMLPIRKDGSTFRDLLHVSPIRNSSGKVAFHVWVHLDESAKHDFSGLTPEVWQLGAVGAVRVAVRSLSASGDYPASGKHGESMVHSVKKGFYNAKHGPFDLFFAHNGPFDLTQQGLFWKIFYSLCS